MVKTVTLLSGQTYIEEQEGEKWSLIPAQIWVEDQAAISEIAIAFQLLYEQRRLPRFDLFLHWLLGKLQDKYGSRWPRLLDAYLESPDAQNLVLEMEINDFLNSSKND